MAGCETVGRGSLPPAATPRRRNSADYDDPRLGGFKSRTWSASMPTLSSSGKAKSGTAIGVEDSAARLVGPTGDGKAVEIVTARQEFSSLSIEDENDGIQPEDRKANDIDELRPGESDTYDFLFGLEKEPNSRFLSYVSRCMPPAGVMNPHDKFVQEWNKFFVVSCLIAIFIDPLFFFLMGVQFDNKCIAVNGTMTAALVVVRSVTDFIYFIHMLLQLKLAYVAPESRAAGAGDLISDPTSIAINYVRGYFIIDLAVVLPLPQITALLILPQLSGSSVASNGATLLRVAIYVPRLCRLLHILTGQSPTAFDFDSAWTNFIMNFLTYVLFGHIFGSCWYLFGLQRVSLCLKHACRLAGTCGLMECGHEYRIDSVHGKDARELWRNNTNITNCLSGGYFDYGIYLKAVNLITDDNIVTRYIYSLFWGFQQISTLAGNQVPSYFWGEVVFTMVITASGLLLFALLIGNIQNFLQALGQRRLEMSLRRREAELWMKQRGLPVELQRRIRRSRWYNQSASGGVKEEMLLEKLPEDLQKDVRRHLFGELAMRSPVLAQMENPILDAISEKLDQKIYIRGSVVFNRGDLVEKVIFIVRGTMRSEEDYGFMNLSAGDFCGEELLSWCFDRCTIQEMRRTRLYGKRLDSNRTVECLTDVEAFVLRATDLEQVIEQFASLFQNSRVQGVLRYISQYWRSLAVTRIQVAWRYYRKKCLRRANAS